MSRKDPHKPAPGEDSPAPPLIHELTDIITADRRVQEILAWLPMYANADLPISITGEPGTGKELLARAICALGPGWRRTCQRLNCAALTESLAASELFGHVRGAFTDARQPRPGKFRMAHEGNLFLDEVGELPLAIQPKLLRAVEQGEIEPVGGDAPVKLDVRLIAATNQDLPRLMTQGRFRRDLFDRLAVLSIDLPPLRERPDDIQLLTEHFTREAARRYGRALSLGFSSAARSRLQQYSWPGNVRELKNVVTRAVLLSAGPAIGAEHLTFASHPGGLPGMVPEPAGSASALRPSPSRLKELLAAEGGNIAALARRLRVCSKTIYRWLRSYQIDPMDLRDVAAV